MELKFVHFLIAQWCVKKNCIHTLIEKSLCTITSHYNSLKWRVKTQFFALITINAQTANHQCNKCSNCRPSTPNTFWVQCSTFMVISSKIATGVVAQKKLDFMVLFCNEHSFILYFIFTTENQATLNYVNFWVLNWDFLSYPMT